MPRVIANPCHTFDDRRHPGQGPEVGAEPMHPSAPAQGGVHPGQLPPIQPRLAPQAPDRLQASPAVPAPGVIPAMRRLSTDAQRVHRRRLRLPAREHARRLEAARFQHRNVPFLGHASAWHRTP